MGIAETVDPTSDQLDAIDLYHSGPRTFTITRVDYKAGAEQPIVVHLAEFPRPWKPGKSMRRVLMGIWGGDEQAYVGRRVTLFYEPRVKFGGKEVGGSRISHMSHIDKQMSVPLIISKGQSATYTVKPLVEDAPPAFDIDACDSIPTLREAWKTATAAGKKRIEARVKELEQAALGDDA